MDGLVELETYVGGLLANVDAAGRRRIARDVGVDLRRANAQRIAAQQNPDGSKYAARKPRREAARAKSGRIRRQAQAMFRKLRQASYLGVEASPDEVAVGFANATVARIARVHQEGLTDRVERGQARPEVRYPVRQLLGFTEEDRGRVLDRVLAALT